MNKYPISKQPYKDGQIIPVNNNPARFIPGFVIAPKCGNTHSQAVNVQTKIHLKDKNGNEMDIYQNQQCLNLLKGQGGNWKVKSSNYSNNQRRKYR